MLDYMKHTCAIIYLFVPHGFVKDNKQCTSFLNNTGCCINYRMVNNECVECETGYFGENCSITCPPGYYGRLCGIECRCGEHQMCHFQNGCMHPSDCKSGNCTKECAKGYQGINCDQTCSPGFFGRSCKSECNCNRSKCDSYDGCVHTNTCRNGSCTESDPKFKKGKTKTAPIEVILLGVLCVTSVGLVCYALIRLYISKNCTDMHKSFRNGTSVSDNMTRRKEQNTTGIMECTEGIYDEIRISRVLSGDVSDCFMAKTHTFLECENTYDKASFYRPKDSNADYTKNCRFDVHFNDYNILQLRDRIQNGIEEMKHEDGTKAVFLEI